MDSLQRMLSRQWTDLSQKRSSKRLTSKHPLDDDLHESSLFMKEGCTHREYLIEREVMNIPTFVGRKQSFSPSRGGGHNTDRWLSEDTMDYSLQIGHLSGVELGTVPKGERSMAMKKIMKASSNVVKQRMIKPMASDSRLVTKLINPNRKATQTPCEELNTKESSYADQDKNIRNKLSSIVQKRGPERQQLLMFEEIATV